MGAGLERISLRAVHAERPSAKTRKAIVKLDCLIVGGGPAGLTAATYLGRFRRRVLIVDGEQSRATWIPVTRNVLGFSKGIQGPDLLKVMREQAHHYGAPKVTGQVTSLEKRGPEVFVGTWEGGQAVASRVLIATGGLDVEPDIKDVRELVKAGLIRHCPICDAYEAMGKRIALVAYGKCRIKEALLLRGYTSALTVLTLGHRARLSAEDEEILRNAGIRIIYTAVEKLTREGNQIAAWIAGQQAPLLFDTIYSALGMKLRADLATSLGAAVDEDGALLVDRHQQTTIAGMYAAGDIVHGLSQINVAAGQAAIAATAINASLPPLSF